MRVLLANADAEDCVHAQWIQSVRRAADLLESIASSSEDWPQRIAGMEREAFEAGFRAKPDSEANWLQHELGIAPRKWDFGPGGSADDLMPEAFAAYKAKHATSAPGKEE